MCQTLVPTLLFKTTPNIAQSVNSVPRNNNSNVPEEFKYTPFKYPPDDTSKFQMSTRPTKHIPADALTYPNSKTNLVPSLHRIRRLRTSLVSRSATRPSLEAPTQQPATASKPTPMYSPTHDYSAPTSTPTPSAHQSPPQPKNPFSTNPTPQHNAQSTTTPSDQTPIVSKRLRQQQRRNSVSNFYILCQRKLPLKNLLPRKEWYIRTTHSCLSETS